MVIRQWAEFTSDLPDDQVEEGAEIVQFGGKSVAEAMHEILGRLGCEVDPVEYADEHGWEFTFHYCKRPLWCQVTLIEKYLAVVEDTSFIRKLFRRAHHPAYLEVLSKLAGAMAQDTRFRDVRWYTDDEVHTDASGSLTPVPGAA